MSNRLKIYACSGIGNADAKYNYWLDNTLTVSNTQAVNSLLSMINLNYSEIQNLSLKTSEVVERLNQIDMYSVAIYYAQVYQDSAEDLHRAGQVIGCLVGKGVFDFDSLSNDERDKHLDDVSEKVADVITDDTLKAPADFTAWWKEIVEDRNKVFLSKEEQDKITSILEKSSKQISGIGAADEEWRNNKDLAKYLDNASEYFLYTYFTKEQLDKLPPIFQTKARVQNDTYNYCKAMYVGVYGSEECMQNVIRAGIMSYFKATPEEVCGRLSNVKPKGVGVVAEATAAAVGWGVKEIIALVTVILTTIASIIASILSCVAQVKVAKYQAVDTQTAQAATPNGDDFDGVEFLSNGNSKTLLYLSAAAVLYLIFKK